MDEAKRCTVLVDQWQYDCSMDLVREGVHTSFSDVIRKALRDYLDSMDEYVQLARSERIDRDDNTETCIGIDINGNKIWVPGRVFATMTEQSHIDDFIDRHNAMLDPTFYE
jgi:Arc/MetJ-type ribon-helix-helix transcriptional regulator